MDLFPRPVPLAWYFEPDLEQAVGLSFFQSRYVGHRLMVPRNGNYAALAAYDYEKILVHGDDGIRLLSNRCRHKRSRIVDPVHRGDPSCGDVGKTGRLMCPVHCWTYGTDGRNLSTPFFETRPADGYSIDLPSEKLQEWNGLLFADEGRDIAFEMKNLGSSGAFDPEVLSFDSFEFAGSESTEYSFNWLVFMDVYFDLYHVAPYHRRTFNQLVDTNDMKWETGDNYSVQVCGFRDGHQGISKSYGLLRTLISELWKGKNPPHGALWFALYPNVMIEWYPLMTVVSTILPTGPSSCRNVVEYFLPAKWASRSAEILEVQKAAYNETAREDTEICMNLSEGYRLDYRAGVDNRGPDHPHLEKGIVDFHEWLRSKASWEMKERDLTVGLQSLGN